MSAGFDPARNFEGGKMNPNTADLLHRPTLVTGLPVDEIRNDFPMLASGTALRLTYLDNASTSLKPRAMIDRLAEFYSNEYAHPEEVHKRSKHVTQLLEEAR